MLYQFKINIGSKAPFPIDFFPLHFSHFSFSPLFRRPHCHPSYRNNRCGRDCLFKNAMCSLKINENGVIRLTKFSNYRSKI